MKTREEILNSIAINERQIELDSRVYESGLRVMREKMASEKYEEAQGLAEHLKGIADELNTAKGIVRALKWVIKEGDRDGTY